MPSNKVRIAHGLRSPIVGETDVQSLTNKTLVSPVVSGGVITGATLTDPIISGGSSIITDATTSIVDDADPTKILKFELSGLTTATTRTVTLPDADLTMASTNTVQTITGAKTFGSAGAVGKLIVAGTTSGTTIINAAAVAGTTTMTLPGTTDTLAGIAATQTFTNKTLTAPVLGGTVTGTYTLGGTPTITSPVISGPSFTGTISAGAVSAMAGNQKIVTGVKTALADTVATNFLLVTIPTGTHGGLLTVDVNGVLGDGDSSHTGTYNIAISRVSGAVAKVVASSMIGTVKTTGATADATMAVTVSAVSGAGGAANTFNVLVGVTRSAGASDNHVATYTASLTQSHDGGWAIAAA